MCAAHSRDVFNHSFADPVEALSVCGVCLINPSSGAVERNHFVKIQIHTSLYCIIALSNLWLISVCLVFGAMTQLMMKQRNKYVARFHCYICWDKPTDKRSVMLCEVRDYILFSLSNRFSRFFCEGVAPWASSHSLENRNLIWTWMLSCISRYAPRAGGQTFTYKLYTAKKTHQQRICR